MRYEARRSELQKSASSILLAAAAFVAACGTVDEAETRSRAEDGAEGTVLRQRCTHPSHGFSVSFPDGWHDNSGAIVPPCTAFDPEPIEIPPASEIPFDIAVVIDVDEVAFERITPPDPAREKILSRERLEVDGREAWRVEAESTGEGLAPPGMRSLRYVVDLGDGRSLIAATHRTDAGEYRRNQDVLEQMVQSLDLSDVGAPGGST